MPCTGAASWSLAHVAVALVLAARPRAAAALGFTPALLDDAWHSCSPLFRPRSPLPPPPGQPGQNYDDIVKNYANYNVSEWWDTQPTWLPEDENELLQGTDGTQNLCIEGMLVPEVVVIGAMKASTTTFSRALSYSPSVQFPTHVADLDGRRWPAAWKEGHYFDDAYYKDDGKFEGRKFMLSDYGACDRSRRFVAVDASARYAVDRSVPLTIKRWYGNAMYSVKFVFLLREPVARLQSHYWHARECGWCEYFLRSSFRKVVNTILTHGGHVYVGGEGRCSDFLEASLYSKSLASYFSVFRSSQFTLIPMKYITEPDDDGRGGASPVKDLWGVLGVRGLDPPQGLRVNTHRHPSVFDELQPKEILALQTRIFEISSPAKIAAQLANSEATLYGLQITENASKKQQIADWLKNNW